MYKYIERRIILLRKLYIHDLVYEIESFLFPNKKHIYNNKINAIRPLYHILNENLFSKYLCISQNELLKTIGDFCIQTCKSCNQLSFFIISMIPPQ